jgi:pimeloyl-ACP methyl ester carboxylesterase
MRTPPARLPAIARDWAHAGVRLAATVLRRGGPDNLAAARPGAPGRCAAVPVVLLPGVWEPWRFLRPLARALHTAGHPVHVVDALGWNGADLDASADRVVAHLRAADVRGGVLVAHSKGGLIGKTVLLRPGLEGRVVGLVAVASPFDGSSLSWRPLARTPLGVFAPLGAAIAGLAGERAVNRLIVSLAPAWDQVVPEGSWLPGARNIALDAGGHFRPLADPRVHALIHAEVHRLAADAEPPQEA